MYIYIYVCVYIATREPNLILQGQMLEMDTVAAVE